MLSLSPKNKREISISKPFRSKTTISLFLDVEVLIRVFFLLFVLCLSTKSSLYNEWDDNLCNILSNNLFRLLYLPTIESINISKDSWYITYSEMGPSISIKISEDEKKVFIEYDYGGC